VLLKREKKNEKDGLAGHVLLIRLCFFNFLSGLLTFHVFTFDVCYSNLLRCFFLLLFLQYVFFILRMCWFFYCCLTTCCWSHVKELYLLAEGLWAGRGGKEGKKEDSCCPTAMSHGP
jgi:hypothetical protein